MTLPRCSAVDVSRTQAPLYSCAYMYTHRGEFMEYGSYTINTASESHLEPLIDPNMKDF